MNNLSMALLQHERNKVKNQIYTLNRKVTLLERFMSDFPNAEIKEAQNFIAFINQTDFAYEVILDRMNEKK